MRVLIQRVSRAAVRVDGNCVGQIGAGVLVFVCAIAGDTDAQADKMASKIAKLRIFKDDGGKMNRSLIDTNGQALVVSQFTLAGDTKSGNRPGFSTAAPPDVAQRLYEHFTHALRALGPEVETGRFGADMAVELVNDGPVTLWLDDSD